MEEITNPFKTPVSTELFTEACRHLVGGVNSPVRAFGGVGGTPLFIRSAKGAHITDEDGHTYIDFVGSWGPMILGHQVPVVMKAVSRAMKNGTSFGAPCRAEVELAQLVKEFMPSIEKIRFTSSGTEATMTALRLARAYTKRQRIVKFEGGYHGHSDSLLVAAGSGATTFGVPSSDGVPEFLAQNTWVLPYNDVMALENLFSKQGPNIAAVIVEPIAGNMGVVEPSLDFMKALVTLTQRSKTLLIFDEVISGFRLGLGGAQARFHVQPDLTCLGKIIGGGFPVGAVGGRQAIMDQLAPLGSVYQAGTLSGNPVAMAAGVAMLRELKARRPYEAMELATTSLVRFIRTEAHRKKIPVHVNQQGTLFTIFFTDKPVTNYFGATQSDAERYGLFFHALLKRGVYFPPSQFEAAFVSAAHTKSILSRTKKIIADALAEIRP